MYCMYVWRTIMEASSTLENIRPPVVSRWGRKVNNCLRLQCQNILLYLSLKYPLTIWNTANVHVFYVFFIYPTFIERSIHKLTCSNAPLTSHKINVLLT